MTYEEARIILLEDALRQAQHTVRFLHDCLIDAKRHKYAYPNQTIQSLDEWYKLLPSIEGCHHSGYHEDCSSCVIHRKLRKQLQEANNVISGIG